MKDEEKVLWLVIIAALMLFVYSDTFPKLVDMVIEWARRMAA